MDDVRPFDPVRVRRVTLLRFATANFVGAVLDFVFNARVLPPALSATQQSRRQLVVTAAALGGYLAVVGAIIWTRGVRGFAERQHWLDEGRAPTDAEREATLRQPWRLAADGATYWIVAAALFSGLSVAFGNPASAIPRVAVGILLGGLTTCALTFLLVERTMRPVFAAALAGAPPGRERYLGIRPRLMLSWALGSGVPFIAIVLVLLAPHRPGAAIARPAALLAGAGLLAGARVMFVAARSVADPIDGMRQAVRRVEAGDLDVDVEVDDGGEVGLLQAGFNQMVAAVRDREQLRDLFGRHVGDDVVRQAMSRQSGLGGEQRDASVLFVDVIGSTALSQREPAARVVTMLNALFGTVVRAVGDEGGWVNKFEGDGCLCVFGAPGDQPDHARRASRAARALRTALGALTAEHPDLDAAIGLSSGAVVAGNVGAEQRYEYTVIGDPVNEAARLTEQAKDHPTRVLAGERTVEAAGPEEAGHWVVAGTFDLRGRAQPTRAYAPLE